MDLNIVELLKPRHFILLDVGQVMPNKNWLLFRCLLPVSVTTTLYYKKTHSNYFFYY